MSESQQEWFLQERTRALAGMYLTRRDDLVIRRADQESGLDFIVSITREKGEKSFRQLGVYLRGALRPTTEERLDKTLHPTMQSFASLGEFSYPICLLYFTMQDDQGYYTWVAEPAVVEDDPRLLVHTEAHCRKLDRQALDEIVRQVDRWYDALFARITVKAS
jgi:hypothetical protein